jgi:hypothetical protein
MATRSLGPFTPLPVEDVPRPAIGTGQRWLAGGVAALAALHLLIGPAFGTASDDMLNYAPTARQGDINPVSLLIDADTLVPIVVRLGSDLVAAYDLVGVRPQPDAVRQDDDGLSLVFAAPRRGPLDLQLDLRPRSIGWVGGQLGVEGSETRTLTQVIHP